MPDNNKAEIESKLRKLFGCPGFDYTPEHNPDNLPPVRIEVAQFAAGRVPELSDTLMKLAVEYYLEGKPLTSLVGNFARDILRILNPLVSLPDVPGATVEDLPVDAIPQCLALFFRSISPGKWVALGSELVDRFGLGGAIEEAKQALLNETKAAQSGQ